MKSTNIQQYPYYASYRRTPNRYPNSASIQYIHNRIVDILLAAAISIAVVAIFLFLLIL